MASAWNLFVKKIFEEGRKQFGKTYKFSQALKDASKRKSEMGNTSTPKKKGSNKHMVEEEDNTKAKTRKAKKSKSRKSKSRKSKSKKRSKKNKKSRKNKA